MPLPTSIELSHLILYYLNQITQGKGSTLWKNTCLLQSPDLLELMLTFNPIAITDDLVCSNPVPPVSDSIA